MGKKNDLKTLAKKAGVSPATVSLALRSDPRVKESTRQRIERLAARYEYTPSHLGRALQSNKSLLIGYLLSSVTASFYSDLVQGVSDCVSRAGYGLLVGITDHSAEKEAHYLQVFKDKQVDGILVSGFRPESRGVLEAFGRSGTPVTACSCKPDGRDIPYITIDDVAGGRLAALHLIDLGHRHLAYGFGPASERYQGACQAAGEQGVAPPRLCPTEEALKEALAGPVRPTAIVAYSDMDAIRIKRVAGSLDLKVPADLSLVGFDDLWIAGQPEYDLTTIAQPKPEIGRLAAELLLDLIRGKKGQSRLIAPELVVRHSTAGPAGA